MPAIPPEPPGDARQRLGRLLIRRRLELGYQNQTSLARATGLNLRLIRDVETAASYRPRQRARTKAEIEDAYRLEPGSVDAVLAGGSLTPLDPAPDPAADLVRETWGSVEEAPRGVQAVLKLADLSAREKESLVSLYASRYAPGSPRRDESSA